VSRTISQQETKGVVIENTMRYTKVGKQWWDAVVVIVPDKRAHETPEF
jgi:hypothetical protein